MNALLHLHQQLASSLCADPQLALAACVAWLDPLWRASVHYDDLPDDDASILHFALCTVRRAFPEVYVDAIGALRQGASFAALERCICAGVTAHGIPLEDLGWMPYGIPMPAYGVTLDDPDFYTQHPDVLPILACLDVTPTQQPPHAAQVAKILSLDLRAQPDVAHQQVGWLLAWLFAFTGNSSLDCDFEMLESLQPLAWEPDELALAVQIIHEAETLLAAALAGLAWLHQQPAQLDLLRQNAQHIAQILLQEKGKTSNAQYTLLWTLPTGGA